MSRHQRLNMILELLAEHGQLDVDDTADRLGVSAATVRRDFDHLAEQQLLTRTHGGAVSTSASYDLPLRYKIARHAEEKTRIAKAAAEMVAVGATVALNGGTTTNEVARAIASRPELASSESGRGVTVVTNALNIAAELAVRPQIKLVVIGGIVRPQSYELIGPLATPVLERIRVDLAFLGVDAIDVEHGAMANHEGEAATNREIVSRAARVVVVADSSKIGASAFAVITPSEKVDMLITDARPSAEVLEQFAERGIEVRTA